MKRKIFAALTATFMLLSLITTAFAADSNKTVVDLGDGYYVVVTVDVQQSSTRSNVVYGSKTGKMYNGSTQIGTATIYGQFDISGSSARALAGNISGSGMNGWSYESGSTSCSGNKVTGSATFSGSSTKTWTSTLYCSSSGVFS